MPAQYGGHEHLFIANKVRSVQCRAGCRHLLDSDYLLKVVPTQRTQACTRLTYAQLLCPVSPLELGEELEREEKCVHSSSSLTEDHRGTNCTYLWEYSLMLTGWLAELGGRRYTLTLGYLPITVHPLGLQMSG